MKKFLRNVGVWIAFRPVSCAFRLHVDTSTHCVPKFSHLWMWDLNSTKSKKEQRAYFWDCQIHFINNEEIFTLPFRNWQRKIITRSSKLSPQNALLNCWLTYFSSSMFFSPATLEFCGFYLTRHAHCDSTPVARDPVVFWVNISRSSPLTSEIFIFPKL